MTATTGLSCQRRSKLASLPSIAASRAASVRSSSGCTAKRTAASRSCTANGAVNGWSLTGDVTVHYDGGLIVPFGTLHYDYIGRDAFAESGAGALALNVRRGKLSTPRTVVGGDIKLDQLLGDTGWAPNARLGWVHDFGVTAGRTDSALAGAPSSFFTTRSSRAGHDAILVGLDVSRAITDNINLFACYNLEARTRRTSQNIMAGARIQF